MKRTVTLGSASWTPSHSLGKGSSDWIHIYEVTASFSVCYLFKYPYNPYEVDGISVFILNMGIVNVFLI
jgi:hypothetical protein